MSYLKSIIFTMGAAFSYLLGGWDNGIKFLVLAIILDYFTGVMAVIVEQGLKGFDWWTGVKGILKKLGLLFTVAVAVLVEKMVGRPNMIHEAIVIGLFFNEVFSIIKNLGRLGVNVSKLQESITNIASQSDPDKPKDGGGAS